MESRRKWESSVSRKLVMQLHGQTWLKLCWSLKKDDKGTKNYKKHSGKERTEREANVWMMWSKSTKRLIRFSNYQERKHYEEMWRGGFLVDLGSVNRFFLLFLKKKAWFGLVRFKSVIYRYVWVGVCLCVCCVLVCTSQKVMIGKEENVSSIFQIVWNCAGIRRTDSYRH